jgi:hypothetical protein
MKIINKFLMLLCFFTFLGCEDFFETTIEIDPPKYEPRIAINSVVENGDTEMIVVLTKSTGILEIEDNIDITLPGAKIDFKLNGVNITTIQERRFPAEGYYEIDLPSALKVGDKIEMKVTYPNLPVAEVTSIIPAIPTISNVKYQQDGGKNIDGSEVSKITFDLTSDVASYFRCDVKINSIYCRSFDTKNMCSNYDTANYAQPIEFTDPSVIDATFVKKSANDPRTKTYIGTTYRNFNIAGSSKGTEIEIYTLDEATYNYEVSKFLYYQSTDNPFATPVNIKSNVKNGYGGIQIYNKFSFKF